MDVLRMSKIDSYYNERSSNRIKKENDGAAEAEKAMTDAMLRSGGRSGKIG